jgi:hypothetical protein
MSKIESAIDDRETIYPANDGQEWAQTADKPRGPGEEIWDSQSEASGLSIRYRFHPNDRITLADLFVC